MLDGHLLYAVRRKNPRAGAVVTGRRLRVPQLSTYALPALAFDATNVYWNEPYLMDIRKAAKP